MDKPRYKLLKDMPTVKAGTIFQEITQEVDGLKVLKEYESSNKVSMLIDEINNFSEWFEETKEPTDSIHWKPKDGDEYFYIDDDGSIFSRLWIGAVWDDMRLELGNVYSTEKECEKARDRKLAEIRLRRTSTFKPDFEDDNGGWVVFYSPREKILETHEVYRLDYGEIVRYETKEEAKKSIKENEQDWKIYFGIEEGE